MKMKWILVISTFFLAVFAQSRMAAAEDASTTLQEQDWWQQVSTDIRKSEYQIRSLGGADQYAAISRAQGFDLQFSRHGTTIGPRTEQRDEWTINLLLLGVELNGAIVTESISEVGTSDPSVIFSRGDLIETITNDVGGLSFVVSVPARIALDESSVLLYEITTDLDVRAAKGTSQVGFYRAGKRIAELTVPKAPNDQSREPRLDVVENTIRISAASEVQILLQNSTAMDTQVGPSLIPDWILAEEQSGSDFGFSVAPAGDVNGDGFSDVIVGAPRFSIGRPNAGRVLVFHGSQSGLSTVPAWSADGGETDGLFGQSVASAGRVNDDVYGDIIIGEPGFNTGQGRALIFRGAAAGLQATSSALLGNGGEFAVSVAGAGDVDGDGRDDVIVGAPQKDGGETTVFFAPFDVVDVGKTCLSVPDGSCYQAANSCALENNNAEFGFSVASAGDINADGFADVIVGAPSYFKDRPGSCDAEGAAFVFLGNTTLTPVNDSSCVTAANWCSVDTLSFIDSRSQSGAMIGFSVAGAGDVNGDGLDDVILGAPLWSHDTCIAGSCSNRHRDVGAAIVYRATTENDSNGRPILLDKASNNDNGGAWAVRGTRINSNANEADAARLGQSVGSAGDVNGDGIGDIIVSGFGTESRGDERGVALIFLGSATDSLPLAENSQWIDLIGNQIDQDVALPDNADWTIEGALAGMHLGRSVTTAGDVDGDGFSDVLIGSTDEALVFRGSGFAPTVSSYESFDSADIVVSAGDVNGDGYGDLLAGYPGAGRVRIFLGPDYGVPSSGGTPTAAWTIGPGSNTGFGSSASTAGDINGDGYGDIIVGEPDFNGGQGRAVIYLSNAGAAPATFDWSASGISANSNFGKSVATAGDVNGDGFSDVIVGSPGSNSVSIYLGSASGLMATAITIDSSGGMFGYAVAPAGDVNADGFSDIIVGAPNFGVAPNDRGAAFIYLGSLTNPLTALIGIIRGDQSGAELGYSVASAGDVNGDGYGDVIVGAPGSDEGLNNTGRVFVHLGEAAGIQRIATWTTAAVARNRFGLSVATAGDTNGDGLDDVLVGSEAGGSVFLGTSSGVSSTSAWTPNGNDNVVTVAGLGDLNRDGFDDVVVGDEVYIGNSTAGASRRPRQHRSGAIELIAPLGSSGMTSQFRLESIVRPNTAQRRLEWEAKVLGTAFDGRGIERGPIVAGSNVSATVGPLKDATAYRWRARISSDSALVPRSPWFSSPGEPQGASLVTAGVRVPPAFAAIGPAPNFGIFADSSPLDFVWHVGGMTSFELQLSPDGLFVDPMVSSGEIRINDRDFGQFTPDIDLWKSALALAQSPDFREAPLFWRVIDAGGVESEVRNIRIAPNEAPTIVSPGAGQSVDAAPTLIWQGNHNDRYQVRFSANSHIGDPRIIIGDGDALTDAENNYDITSSECVSTPDFCFTIPASVWLDVKSLSASGSDGTSTVYFAVFALDTLGRTSFSASRNLRVMNPGTTPPTSSTGSSGGGGPIGPLLLLLLVLGLCARGALARPSFQFRAPSDQR